MLKLKGVSKFYYSKGIVTSGFSKVSLSFDLGEFVAITGESGSGKSTLLNVLSGLDSYEEGEMYVNGKETSHYTEKDYEVYRKKYIGNIFQNFNLVNSYTVYQNVELVLLLNGYKKKDIKEKVLKIIKDVDLIKYKNRRVSKLSGGQKQRVAIARALAKDTPIILADEPTGNLDSRSSESVLKLLSEIAKNKLVIIVTHNYDQIEKYVTRKVTMHDGKVLEDKKIKDAEKIEDVKEAEYKDILWFNKIRLGIRNTFNIIPKFLLIFAVYLFIVLSFTAAYSSFKKSEYEVSKQGYNQFFNYVNDKRIVIQKNDRTALTDEDFDKISKVHGVDRIVKNDLSLDNSISLSSSDHEELYFYGISKSISELDNVDVGRMPENEREVVIYGSESDYYIQNMSEEILNTKFYIENLTNYTTNERYEISIVGIKYKKESSIVSYSDMEIYISDEAINKLVDKINKEYSTLTYTFAGTQSQSYFDSIVGEIIPSKKVPKGKYMISEEMTYQCKNAKCKSYKLQVNVESVYFKDSLNLSYYNCYKKKNFTKLTGLKYNTFNGAIFINTDDYYRLFNKGYFQSSVFLDNVDNKNITMNTLTKMGYKPLYIMDTIQNYFEEELAVIRIVKVITLGGLLLALFFISYFIIKIILKSRNVYFATLRILGASGSSVKQFLNIELSAISHTAYILFIGFMLLVNNSIINIEYFKDMYSYLTLLDYVFVYLLLFVMSRLITNRYSRKLFNTTAMNAYKEEV